MSINMKQAFATVVILLLLAGAGMFAYVKFSANGFSARAEPSVLEKILARAARSMAVPDSVKAVQNPQPDNAEVLSEARAHWADHCAGCHANNGNGDTEMGRNMYPRAPDMRQAGTQNLSDGELFFIIENGIRLADARLGGSAHSSEDSWKLVRFIRHLPQIASDEERDMRKMNPRTPAEMQEEKEEEEFLNGDDSHAQHHSHH